MHYGKINRADIANGPGVRVSLFVSGCRNYCKGCFNKDTWDFDYGQPFTMYTMNDLIAYLGEAYVDGFTILGGEPFDPRNQSDICWIIRTVRKVFPDMNIWIYTGYLYNVDLKPGGKAWTKYTDDILNSIDTLVDGPFIEEQKDITLGYRGSRNQRIIDLKQEKERTYNMDIITFLGQQGYDYISRAFLYTEKSEKKITVQEGLILHKRPVLINMRHEPGDTVFVPDGWDMMDDFYMEDHRCAVRQKVIYRDRLWLLTNDKEFAAKIFAMKRKMANYSDESMPIRKEDSDKHIYIVTVTDTATYTIKANSKELAVELAQDYFSERDPECVVAIDDNSECEVEI